MTTITIDIRSDGLGHKMLRINVRNFPARVFEFTIYEHFQFVNQFGIWALIRYVCEQVIRS